MDWCVGTEGEVDKRVGWTEEGIERRGGGGEGKGNKVVQWTKTKKETRHDRMWTERVRDRRIKIYKYILGNI